MTNPPSTAAASVVLAPLVALSVTYSCVYDWDAKSGAAGGEPTTTTSSGTGADDAGATGGSTSTGGSGGATSTTSSIGPSGGAGGVEPDCVGTPFPCGDGPLTCCAPLEYCLLESGNPEPLCVPCAPCQAQDPPCPCMLVTPECLADVAACPDASCEVVGDHVEVRCG